MIYHDLPMEHKSYETAGICSVSRFKSRQEAARHQGDVFKEQGQEIYYTIDCGKPIHKTMVFVGYAED